MNTLRIWIMVFPLCLFCLAPAGLPAADGTVLTAEELFSAYTTDRRHGDALYTNRWLMVRGIVQSFCCNPIDGYQVVLRVGPYRTARIECSFNKFDFDSLYRLKEGQEVRVYGRCLGLWDRAVLLSTCRISGS